MTKKKRQALTGVVIFCLLALVLYGVWKANRPAAAEGMKSVTVEVVHSDGSRKEFSYTTEEDTLEDLLRAEGLISGTEGAYGLFVDTVDGEMADYEKDGGWWRLTCGGQDSETGAKEVLLEDGGTYGWIYTTS